MIRNFVRSIGCLTWLWLPASVLAATDGKPNDQPITDSNVDFTDGSPIFSSARSCRAIASRAYALCDNEDCRALLLSQKFRCETTDCEAMVLRNPGTCETSDCRAVILGAIGFCRTQNCRGIVSGNQGYCSGR